MLGLIVWVECCLFIIQNHGQQSKDTVTNIVGTVGKISKINSFQLDMLAKWLK